MSGGNARCLAVNNRSFARMPSVENEDIKYKIVIQILDSRTFTSK
jgi:hypothetical protein